MNKKELEELYYIHIDDMFMSSFASTKYCDQESFIKVIFSFMNQGNNQFPPFNSIVANMGEKSKDDYFCYYANSFIELSLEQDNHNGLLYKNIIGQSKDKVIEYIKNYINNENYSQILHITLGKYLSDSYTFDLILKEYLNVKYTNKAAETITQHEPQIAYEQPIGAISYKSSQMHSNVLVEYKNSITHFHPSNVSDAIKINYATPFIISIPFLILFCCIAYAIIKCCRYVLKNKILNRETVDCDNHLPRLTCGSLEYGLEQFKSEKNL